MSAIGLPIGLYGYLLPGNINLMVMELFSSKKYRFLAIVLLLIIIFETIYCASTILFLDSIKTNPKLYNTIEITSYFLTILMGIWMLSDSNKNLSQSRKKTIYRGIFSIVVHPQQIPFWIVFGVFANNFIPFDLNDSVLFEFLFFNAIGTSLAMFFYMYLGKKIFNFFKINIANANKFIGLVYILIAFYGLYS